MAPCRKRPLRLSIPLHRSAVAPSPLTGEAFLDRFHGNPSPLSSHFLACTSSPASSSPALPSSIAVDDPLEPSFLSHAHSASNAVISSGSTCLTLGKSVDPRCTSADRLASLPCASCRSSSSLSAYHHVAVPYALIESHQPVYPPTTAAILEAKAAATPAVNSDSASAEPELVSAQRAIPPASKVIPDEKYHCITGPLQESLCPSKCSLSIEPSRRSPACSHTSFPVSLRSPNVDEEKSTAAAEVDDFGWAAAPLSCYNDCHAHFSSSHIIPRDLGTFDSLHERTLLVTPAVEVYPPLEGAETLHAGLRLDSPSPTQLNSPTPPCLSTPHDQTEQCTYALTSTLGCCTSESVSQAAQDGRKNKHHPPVLLPLRSKSSVPACCERRMPRVHHKRGLKGDCTHPVETKAVKATAPAAEKPESLPANVGPQEREMAEAHEKKPDSLPVEKEGKTGEQAKLAKGNFCRNYLEKTRICSTLSCPSNVRGTAEGQSDCMSPGNSSSLPYKRNLIGCAGSLQLCNEQTIPETSVTHRGINWRKRRRESSSPPISADASNPLELPLLCGRQCFMSAARTAASVDGASRRHTALCPNFAPAAASSTTASPTGYLSRSSSLPAGSLSPRGAFAYLSPTTPPVAADMTAMVRPTLSGTGIGAAGAIESTSALSANVGRNSASLAVDSVSEAAAALNYSVASFAVDSESAVTPAAVAASVLSPAAASAPNHLACSAPARCTAQGSQETLECSIDPTIVPASTAAPSSLLTPGAFAYALAAKLFGFTPTPGFLPDPNPFDNPDYYLSKNLKIERAVAASDWPELHAVDSAVKKVQMTGVMTKDSTSCKTLPTLAAEPSTLGCVPARALRISPFVQCAIAETDTTAAHLDIAQHNNLEYGRSCRAAAAIPYYATCTLGPPGAVRAAPHYCDSYMSNISHAHTQWAAAYPVQFNGNTPISLQSGVTGRDNPVRPTNIYDTRYGPHAIPSTLADCTHNGAYAAATGFVNEVEYIPEGACLQDRRFTSVEGRLQIKDNAHQRVPVAGENSHCIGLLGMKTSQRNQNYCTQGGQRGAVHGVYDVHDAQGAEIDGEPSTYTAQFPQAGGPRFDSRGHKNEERRSAYAPAAHSVGRESVQVGHFDNVSNLLYDGRASEKKRSLQTGSYGYV